MAIESIDTRALVRRLRSGGALKGVLSTIDLDDASLVAKAKASPGLVGRDLVREVLPDQPFEWQQPLSEWTHLDGHSHVSRRTSQLAGASHQPHVVALDYGMKWNIPRHLVDLGCRVTILPGTATADEVLAQQPDGVFLSNGPGDPEPLEYAISTIRGLLGKKPIFGICLGHQLLGLACGAQTFKLKFGHRGANHPVQNLGRGQWKSRRRTTASPSPKIRLPEFMRSDAPQPERQHDRRHRASRRAGLQRAVSSRSFGRAARQPLSVPALPGIDGNAKSENARVNRVPLLATNGGPTTNRRALLASQRWQTLNRKQCFFDVTMSGGVQAVAHCRSSGAISLPTAR